MGAEQGKRPSVQQNTRRGQASFPSCWTLSWSLQPNTIATTEMSTQFSIDVMRLTIQKLGPLPTFHVPCRQVVCDTKLIFSRLLL